MTVLHPACCGPQHATNVHCDCPRVFAGWGGEVLRCECGCHAGIAMQVRDLSVKDRYPRSTKREPDRANESDSLASVSTTPKGA